MKASNIVRSAVIEVSATGAAAIVAAVEKMKIRVLGFIVSPAGAVNVKFQSGSTDISGLFYGATGVPIVAPCVSDDNHFWFETGKGQALNINLSADVAVGGVLLYKIIPAES